MSTQRRGPGLLDNFEADQLERLLWYLDRVHVDAGELLISAGDVDQTLYVVVRGRFEVLVRGAVVAVLGAGQVLGELAFFDAAPRSASVQALEPGELLRLNRARFQDLVQRDPGLAVDLTLELGRALAERFRAREGS